MPDAALDLFLDQLFSTVPVVQPSVYIASATAQVRRSLNHRDVGSLRSSIYRLPELPVWLQPHELGPYEASLLAMLLSSPGPVISIRGGSGSGKSSVLGYLTRHVAKCAESLSETQPAIGYREFIVQLDVQTYVAASADNDRVGAMTDELLTHIARALEGVVRQLDDALSVLVLERTMQDKPCGEPLGIRHNVVATISGACRPSGGDWAGYCAAKKLDVFGEAVAKLAADERLVAWLAVFRTIHRLMNEGAAHANEWPLVLVLDNVDPLNDAQQSTLLETLSRITSGPSWGLMRIVLAARLSTYHQHIGAFRFQHYDHEAHEPAELILIRTTLALLAPEAFTAFCHADSQSKNRIYDVLLEFFGHLADRSYFFDLLSALSGTNIRAALGHAHRWCMSVRANPIAQEPWEKDDFKKALLETICRNYLEEFARRIGHEADEIVRELVKRVDPARIQPDQVTDELFSGMLRVIRSAEPCCDFDASNRSPRAVLGKRLNDGLMDQLRGEVHPWANTMLKHSVMMLFELAERKRVSPRVIEDVATGLVERLTSLEGEPPVARALGAWIALGIDGCAKQRYRLRDLVRERRSALVVDIGASASFNSSRFVAETALLVSKDAAGHDVSRALNVFSMDGSAVCPVVLRVLYLLWFRGDADMTRQQLVQCLQRYRYSDEQIVHALSAMLALNQRLIFSGIDDHLVPIEDWIRNGSRVVKLSTVGAGYLETVLGVPSYHQWALRFGTSRTLVHQGRTLDARTIRGRLVMALRGFESVLLDEEQRIEHAWKHGESRSQISRTMEAAHVQASAADVFYRVLDSFMHVYVMNHNFIYSTNRGEAQALQGDAMLWVELARRKKMQLHEVFGRAVDKWSDAIREAEIDIQIMRAGAERGRRHKPPPT